MFSQKLTLFRFASAFAGILLALTGDTRAADETPAVVEKDGKEAVTVKEARGRAQLLYEVVRGALQVMHRDFFDPDDRDRIPSASLEDMFDVVAETKGVEMRWLGVNAKTMDTDHKPQDDFEKKAVAALDKGDLEFESVEKNTFRYVGAIRLHNRCLKCHVPFRTSLEDRSAGLAISIPIQPGSANSAKTNSH